MSIVQLVAAAQPSGTPSGTGNPPSAEYFLIAIVAAVLALVAMIFIRTLARKSSKQ
ncbi:MAG: hypothetical protein WBV28_11965 [Terracidiphilus sp.]